MLIVTNCKCKIEAVSILFGYGGIYRIEWRLAKSKLSNELESGSTYGMTYYTNIDTHVDRQAQ